MGLCTWVLEGREKERVPALKKRFFGEVIASLESGERMEREAANSACLRELRRNNQARGVVCTPRAWMCLNGGAVRAETTNFLRYLLCKGKRC